MCCCTLNRVGSNAKGVPRAVGQGNIGRCLFMTLRLVKQIPISFNGGNLISARKSTGKWSFTWVTGQNSVCFYSWPLNSLWVAPSLHTLGSLVMGRPGWEVAQLMFCWKAPKYSAWTVDLMANSYWIHFDFGDQSLHADTAWQNSTPASRDGEALVRKEAGRDSSCCFKLKMPFSRPWQASWEKHELPLTGLSAGSRNAAGNCLATETGLAQFISD